MKKILFIDRDGTIIEEPDDKQIDSLEKLEFLPGAITALSKIVTELDFTCVLVSNQDGLGTDSFPESDFLPPHQKMLHILKGEGVSFDEILIDKSFPQENAITRKPRTGLVTHYIKGNYDLANSYVIGDRVTDVEFARNIGCKAIHISNHPQVEGEDVWTSNDWDAIYRYLKATPRMGLIKRKTLETDIEVSVNLDGRGESEINTGLPFFDHMLEQLGKHGELDLFVDVKGDLSVDDHHTIEDTAIALGEAFKEALGSKKGIARYGFLLPMDDALSQVAIDFGGRSWLVWEANFIREKVGNLSTEMFEHFFKSFCDGAQCNLNVKSEGKNEHHKIESIFKAVANAIKIAVKQDGSGKIASTKGMF